MTYQRVQKTEARSKWKEKNNEREKDESRRLEAHEDELLFEGRYYFMVILSFTAGRVTA
jgi:hypothetical protein